MAYTTGTTTTLVSKTGHRAAALAHSVPAGDAQHVRPDRLLYSEKRKQFDRKRVGCLKISNCQASLSIELLKSRTRRL